MEETTMQQRQQHNPRQPDLFCPTSPAIALPGDARQRLLPLIGALLREATGQTKEADHEDHA
jgi:hypothetical protein